MRATVEIHELADLDIKLRSIGRVFDYKLSGQTLRDAAKPMLTAVRQEASIGPFVFYKSATITRGKRKGKPRPVGGYYRRGAATRNDARIKVVPGSGNEQARILVGIAKSKGKVGWRTHFITRRLKKRKSSPNDFLANAESRTIDVVISRFGASAQVVIERALKRAAR